MPNVHILPPDIVSKIAAGEVIDRPASVVKELLENSLDAGASAIELHLVNAGKTSICIKDDGHGIDHEDLDKIFLRHATSKIEHADDLFNIHSLGFRGEALYSVAAIADVVLQSQTKAQDSGWEIHVRAGEQIHCKPCTFGHPGTEIEIKELFFNTPARKKFLKTNTTEIHQILNTFIPYTLLYPQIRFLLNHQGKDLLDLHQTDNPLERIADTLNIDMNNLIESSTEDLEQKCTIKMILGDINIKRTRRDMQFVFVNGRPVQNKSISYHMNQIYRLIMPDDFFPLFVLMIELPPEDIDVNIHPAKREIKMKDEQAICSKLRSLCERTLMETGTMKQVGAVGAANNQLVNQSLSSSNTLERKYSTLDSSDIFESPSVPSSGRIDDDYAYPISSSYQNKQEFFIPEGDMFQQNLETLQSKLELARYIGPFMKKFLLFESGKSLLIIDQHAAAERITYEHLIRQMGKGELEVQNLLAPVTLKLSPGELLLLEEFKDELKKSGFDCSLWDDETLAIHSHPQLIPDVEKAVRHILTGESVNRASFETIASRACRSSIMAGDKINASQAEYQREQLLQCLDPFTCPHGRPTVIEMKETFLDKQFLRT